jgi:hypothetical protein
MSRGVWIAAAVLGVGFSTLAPEPAAALPRYTARYEQKCALCHVNPSGGGLRNTYATRKLIPEEIAWLRHKPAAIEEVEQKLGNLIQIGADFREFYVGADVPQSHLNFFEMQADLYFAFQLDPKVTLYYDRGQSGNYEMFGLGYLLPTVYVKAGRFIPSYGWKFDDHTMYVRADLGFMPPGNSDVGLEAGLSKGGLDVQIAVVNGSRGTSFDTDTKAAGVANAIYRARVGPVGAALGVSGYHHPGELRDFDTRGLFSYLTWNRLTWLGEADLFREEPTGGSAVEGLVTSHEATVVLRQGLELKATYDFYDPDRDLATGARSRWGGGVFIMPQSYVTLEALVRRTKYENGLTLSGRDFTETLLQLHLLY